jgi:hypothetical protein
MLIAEFGAPCAIASPEAHLFDNRAALGGGILIFFRSSVKSVWEKATMPS